MNKIALTIFTLIIPVVANAQVNEIKFSFQPFNSAAPPRTGISPFSMRMIDNYNQEGPTNYGTILEIYGRDNHQTGQLYFGGWDNSRIRYREAFWDQNYWSEWAILLDSKNHIQSVGNLIVQGTGNSTISGNLGIGTANPTAKLSVNGNIRAHEIKVETANWPDYVFSKGYQLPSLAETEKHIKDKGHLPGIPSARDAEANGVELGEMNKKLLQKIEELTLHLIDLKKESEQHKQEIKVLKSKLKYAL